MAYIGQREDEWEAEQKKRAKRAKRKLQVRCPTCGKLVMKIGLKDHLRDVHNQEVVPPEPKKIEVRNIENA